jgi:hypothetical protein
MTRSEYCRSKAEECDLMARSTRDPRIKAQLEKRAADWRKLADELDRMYRKNGW